MTEKQLADAIQNRSQKTNLQLLLDLPDNQVLRRAIEIFNTEDFNSCVEAIRNIARFRIISLEKEFEKL